MQLVKCDVITVGSHKFACKVQIFKLKNNRCYKKILFFFIIVTSNTAKTIFKFWAAAQKKTNKQTFNIKHRVRANVLKYSHNIGQYNFIHQRQIRIRYIFLDELKEGIFNFRFLFRYCFVIRHPRINKQSPSSIDITINFCSLLTLLIMVDVPPRTRRLNYKPLIKPQNLFL